MSGSALRLGRISAASSRLLLCDMQDKFRPNIAHFDDVVANSNRVLRAADVMGVATLATEQYPKGLGRTVKELGLEQYGIKPFEKTCFSMVIPELMKIAGDDVKCVLYLFYCLWVKFMIF